MFRNWGFLIAEIWLLLVLAGLLGLFCGWVIWGRGVQLNMRSSLPGTKPILLVNPRGVADDLKLIKGIDRALEDMCHSLGIWHFDQIAAWTAEEITWVDANLEGVKGRILRDDWVGQAKRLLASKR